MDSTRDPGSFIAYVDRSAAILSQIRVEVMQLLDLRPECAVLDVGSGAGEFLIEAARRVDLARAVGIDISKAMVSTARLRRLIIHRARPVPGNCD